MKRLINQALVVGLAAALVVGALAVANQGSGQNGTGERRAGPPRILGNLTYAESHVQLNGKGVVFRVDRGKVKSVESDSITVTENDGSDVTIPTDGNTRVFAGPRRGRLKLSDLKEGQTVMVHRQEGEAADFVGLPPRRGDFRHFRGPHPGPGGPGPGAFPAPPPGG
jgi:hypothetical protein